MNNAQTIFTLYYAIYFAVTITLTGKFQPFDTPSMYKWQLFSWLRFVVSFFLLNVVPLACFVIIFRLVEDVDNKWFTIGNWIAFNNMLILLTLSLAGFGFYRVFFGLMLLKYRNSYFFYGTELPKPVEEKLDQRPESHLDWKAHVLPGIFWVAHNLVLAYRWV
jgi:hypothetical protein